MSKMVFRTLDFFEAFAAQKRPLTQSELIEVLGIPVSSCHDVLRALEARGYVHATHPRGGFYPTTRLLELAREIGNHDPFLARVEPSLMRLRDNLNESIFLCKAHAMTLGYVAVIESDSPLRLAVRVGDRIRALHATSAGKALLASLGPDELKAALAGLRLEPLTPNTLTSRSALLRDLRESESRGWFINREESVEDMLTVSARIPTHGAVHVVTVAGSAKRMERKLDAVVTQLREVVRALGDDSM